ncbi:transporter [candidate division KSB1 bacterium]|nr:transporter [candidate division KSB1 bacterium]
MRSLRLLGIIITVALLAQAPTFACSVCRCGDQSFFLNNARMLGSGRLLFAVEHFNTRKSAMAAAPHDEHGLGLAKFSVPFGIQHGEAPESQVQNSVQLTLKYGLSSRFVLMASVPYTFNRISSEGGAATADGLGDPEIMVMAHLLSFANGAWQLQGVAGGRVPLGNAEQKNAAGELLDQHLQTGSGAWAGIFGVQLLHASGSVPLFLNASYQANSANDQKFAYGNVFRFNAAAQKALFNPVEVIAEINGRTADYDDDAGETDPNSGGTVVYFSPGLRLRLGGALSLRGQVQIPVVEDLHDEQNEKVNVRTGLVWTL